MQLVTLGQEECAVELLIAIARELEADHLVAVQRVECDMLGLLQNLRHAAAARTAFIEAVTRRAGLLGIQPSRVEDVTEAGDVALIGGQPFPRSYVPLRKQLLERIKTEGFTQVMEAMAYTWFNRLVALRYMELHGYLDHGYRVLSDPLGGAGADFQPVQIMPQDEARNIARRVAFLLVDEIQKIEGVGEHVPAAHGGIEQSNILWLGDAEEVGFRLALDVVGHVLAQPGAWAIEQPEAAEGVLHKVANDPVWSEELDDGVKVNYAKLGPLVAEAKKISGTKED